MSILFATAFSTMITKDGTSYSADANGMITTVQAKHVLDLLKCGATIAQASLYAQNLVATTDPTINDDTADGYGPGSIWVNTTGNRVWVCETAGAGAASWIGQFQEIQNVYTAISNAAGVVYTAAQVFANSKAIINRSGVTGTANDQMPLASSVIALMLNGVTSQNYILRVMNGNSDVLTITTNTGVTLSGTMTIAAGAQAEFLVVRTSGTTISVTRCSV